jgi:hypothetical protein
MEKTPKLSDAQLVILNAAAAREDGLAIPPAAMGEAARSAVAKALVKRGLLAPIAAPTSMPEAIWKGPGAALRITPPGFGAIGVDAAQRPLWALKAALKAEPAPPAEAPPAPAQADPAAPAPKRDARRRAAEEAAARGELPAPPDFSAETHKPYRGKLERLIALVIAGDIAGLRAMPINPISTSPRALARFRDLSVIALEARAKE